MYGSVTLKRQVFAYLHRLVTRAAILIFTNPQFAYPTNAAEPGFLL